MVISLSKHVPNKLRKLNEEVAQFSTIQKLQARAQKCGSEFNGVCRGITWLRPGRAAVTGAPTGPSPQASQAPAAARVLPPIRRLPSAQT
jgi:hypothetical protein